MIVPLSPRSRAFAASSRTEGLVLRNRIVIGSRGAMRCQTST